MKRIRRQILLALGLSGMLGYLVPSLAAYPEKPVSLVVVFGAGGTNDVLARMLSEPLGHALGQTVVVENRPGAGGNIGAASVARSAPDGHTLLLAFPGLTTNASLYQSLHYDPVKDFTPISLLASAPSVLVTRPTSTAESLEEFKAELQARQGGANYGSAGVGTSSHLAAAMLNDTLKLDMQHIAYKGGAAALTDLAAGRIDVMTIPVPEVASLVQAGKVRALAVADSRRSALLPDVPTTQEWGLDDFEVGSWYGLSAPKGLPDEVSQTLTRAVKQVMSDEALQQRLEAQGITVVGSSAPEFSEFLANETTRWSTVIRNNNIQLD